MKGLGILEVNGNEYVVLRDKDANMPSAALRETLGSNTNDTRFVARRFSIETINIIDGETTVSKTDEFYTPRWMTIHGNYTINWFPEPMEVDVEDTWVKQEEK